MGDGVVVRDSIIGAGVSEHQDGGSLTGNTNIYVYGVLSENGNMAVSSNVGYRALVGGFARHNNSGVEWMLDGSTNITVDVSAYSGAAKDFVKAIYGGHVSSTNSHIGTITGDTNVSISANDLVRFTSNIVAGSYKDGHETDRIDRIDGDTTLTINGGVIQGNAYLTAGSILAGGCTEIGGTAAVILNGGTINRNLYAAGIIQRDGAGYTSTVGASRVEVAKGVNFGTVTLSGGFGGSQADQGTVVGNRTLALGDGAAIGSSVTVKDFSHIEVEEGRASLDAGKLAMGSFTKTGAGTLELGGTALTKAFTFNVESGRTDGVAELEVSSQIGTASVSEFSITKNGAGAMLLSGDNLFKWGVNLNAGRLIAGHEHAFGDSSVKVAAGATLEIAKDVYVTGLQTGTWGIHSFEMANGSELVVHSLRTDVAALTARGVSGGASQKLGNITLTLADDMLLEAGAGAYKVLGGLSSLDGAVTLNNMSMDNRLDLSTSFTDGTLWLNVAQGSTGELVWGGTEGKGSWSTGLADKNWDMAGIDGKTYFMEGDTARFTAAAENKSVEVAAAGVKASSVKVEAAGYSFTGGTVQTHSVELAADASLGKLAMVARADGSCAIAGTAAAGSPAPQLSATEISIAAGASLTMSGLSLTETSCVSSSGGASLVADGLTVALGTGNCTALTLGDMPAEAELVACGSGSAAAGALGQLYTLDSSALAHVVVGGSLLTLDLSSYVSHYAEAIQDDGYLAIRFGTEALGTASFDVAGSDKLVIRATLDGASFTEVFYDAQELIPSTFSAEGSAAPVTLYVKVEGKGAVPEPATATLSLLALAALAARRRRRG